jgi:exopolyphosphatase/guanosine-5'-triphosphate,3'-diphosphate pyrophosphatase
MASITFRNWMITNLKKTTIKEKSTPNPVGQEDSVAALEFVKKYMEKQMNDEFRQNIKEKVVIGVGGVHTFLMGKMNGTTMKVDRRMLGREIRELRQYSDRGVGGGRFASTKVSNLIMILGQMEAMGIDEYYVINTNPLVGLLLFHEL